MQKSHVKTATFALALCSIAGSVWAEISTRSCVVKEVLEAAPYSYIRCQEAQSEIWLSCMTVPLKIGERILFSENPMIENFTSKTLNRTFSKIMFVPALSRENGEAIAPAPEVSELRSTPLQKVGQGGDGGATSLPEAGSVEANQPLEESEEQDSFSQALAEGDVKTVSKFLPDSRYIERKLTDDKTPLMLAARYGHKAVVALLLDRGARVDARDTYGGTALMHAAKGGSVETVRQLLERQAKVNDTDNGGDTPLMYACSEGNVSVIKLLVQHGADVRARNMSGITALMKSCRSKQVLELLISLGADAGEVDNDGNNLLMRAVRHQEHIEYDKEERAEVLALIQYLLSLTKNLEIRNKSGETALIAAYTSKNVLELLLKAGADPNARDARGESALMRAATGNYFDSVKLLLKYKANINLADNSGHNALWLAMHGSPNNQMMVKLLKDLGAQDTTTGPKEFACEKPTAELTFDMPGTGGKRQLLFLTGPYSSLQVLVREEGVCRVVLTERVSADALKERVALKHQPGTPYPDINITQMDFSKPVGEEKYVKTYVWKGNGYQQKGYQESVTLNRRALALMGKGKLSQAIALWNQAYNLVYDGNVEMLNNLGFAYYKQGMGTHDQKSFALSELYLNKAIGREPDRWQAYLNLADLQAAMGKKTDATYNYERAISLNTNKKSAAKIRQKLDALQEAAEVLEDLTTIRQQVAKNLPVYSFKIKGDSEGVPREIIVTDTSTSKEIQQIDLLQDCDELGRREDGGYIELVDINFDGNLDISLLAGSGATGNSDYVFWLFDPRSKKFVFDKDFAHLGTFSLDAARKQIATHSNGGHAGMIHYDSVYEVRSGKPVLITEINQDYDEKKGYYVEETKELVNGEMKVTGKRVVARE